VDGCTLDTEGEKERVIKCIEAAIQRRVSEVMYDLIFIFYATLTITKIDKDELPVLNSY
jgi:hypothetical protein